MEVDAFPNYQNVQSRWGLENLEGVDRRRTGKQVLKAGSTAASVASNATQMTTGISGYALVTGAVAASALGIGVVAVGGALTIGSSIYAARSAYKSRQHRDALTSILLRGNSAYPCNLIPTGVQYTGVERLLPRHHVQHNMVFEQVVPYVMQKKDTKFTRKVVSAVPGLGLLESLRAVAKKGYKAASGTLGVHRREAARWLAVHLITHNCALAQAVVSELYSFEEMTILQTFESEKLVPFLMDKMKST